MFSSSCHKNKGKTCVGSFIAFTQLSSGGASGATQTFASIDANTGEQVNNYQLTFVVNSSHGKGVYDAVNNAYYLYTRQLPHTGGDTIFLQRTDFSSRHHLQYPSLICDTLIGWQQFDLLLNSASNKLYFLSRGGVQNKIYEISFAPGFSEKLIFTADTLITTITAPVVDEATGAIYFFSKPYLKKVDPSTGILSTVATYTDVVPSELQYNSNDGMFYGVNVYAPPYKFIRIAPKDGSVARLSEMNYFYVGMHHTFDVCNNRYIMDGGNSIYWLDPSNGNVTKQVDIPWPFGKLTYINQSKP